MPATFDWDHPEEIGIRLADKYPATDPLTIRFTDLSSKPSRWPGTKNTKTATEIRTQLCHHRLAKKRFVIPNPAFCAG